MADGHGKRSYFSTSDAEERAVTYIIGTREGHPTQYEAPEKGDKMRALYAIGLMRMSPSATAVGTALVYHASARSGRCDPRISRLVRLTGLSRRSVINALNELAKNGVIDREHRFRQDNSQASSAYHIQWETLRRVFAAFEGSAKKRTPGGVKVCTPGDEDICTPGSGESCTPIEPMSVEPMSVEPMSGEPHRHETVRQGERVGQQEEKNGQQEDGYYDAGEGVF